jgi:hypothetical protein
MKKVKLDKFEENRMSVNEKKVIRGGIEKSELGGCKDYSRYGWFNREKEIIWNFCPDGSWTRVVIYS